MTTIRKKIVRFFIGLLILIVMVFAILLTALWRNNQSALSPLPVNSEPNTSLSHIQ